MPRPPPTTRTCRIRVVLLRRTRRPVSEHRCAALVIKIQSRSCSRTDPHVWVTVGGVGALGARCARACSLHVRWLHSLVRSLVRWLVRWFVRSFSFVRYLRRSVIGYFIQLTHASRVLIDAGLAAPAADVPAFPKKVILPLRRCTIVRPSRPQDGMVICGHVSAATASSASPTSPRRGGFGRARNDSSPSSGSP